MCGTRISLEFGQLPFRAAVLGAELARFEPDIMAAVETAVDKATSDLSFIRLEPDAFARAPMKSIDYAVMENSIAPRS